jgi:hypothetical protein
VRNQGALAPARMSRVGRAQLCSTKDSGQTRVPGATRDRGWRPARRLFRSGLGQPLGSQALTLSLLAVTHFFAAASGLILSWAMYLATSFWSSLVHLKFLTNW